jgi:hypothetical protein
MKSFALLLAVSLTLALYPSPVHAQGGGTITGRITGATEMPLNAVSVRIDALGIETTTGADGTYSLVVPASRISGGQKVHITFKRDGFIPQSRKVTLSPGAQVTLNIQMRQVPRRG